ncbi:hypothetical protein D3C80_1003800 [compost metagenome]
MQHRLPAKWIHVPIISQQHGLDGGASLSQSHGNILQALPQRRRNHLAGFDLNFGKVLEALAGICIYAPIPTVQIQVIPPGQQRSGHTQFINGKTGVIETQGVIAVCQAIPIRSCALRCARLACHQTQLSF